jgi:hypothetical protein
MQLLQLYHWIHVKTGNTGRQSVITYRATYLCCILWIKNVMILQMQEHNETSPRLTDPISASWRYDLRKQPILRMNSGFW